MFSPLNRSTVSLGAAALVAITPAGLRAYAAEYLIQPEDTLAIKVSGEPDLSKNYTVSADGEITVDMLGKVKVSGLSQKQVTEKLTEGLKKYLKLFEVSVLVVGDTGGKAAVYGEVGRPGQLRVKPGTRLLDIISDAGGATPNANTKQVTITRKGGGKTETVDLDAVLRNPELNVEITAGDTITIPSRVAQTVTVDGEVQTPGEKPLETAKTAYDAIIKAGPKGNVDWTRVILRRRGSSLPLTVDLSKVRAGQLKDDLELQEGDRITVQSKFSGTATLGGEVETPGEKELLGQTQILEFIRSSGGGLKPGADRRRVQVIRGSGDPVVIDLTAIERGDRRSDDPMLEVRPGDRIFVPTSTATLAGQVKNLGVKSLGDSTSVYDFINNAGGGLTDKADPARVQIRRNGKLLRTVDLTRVSAGLISSDDPDLQIEPGDIVFVPDDSRSRFVILGGVTKPGAYAVKPGMTLMDAVSAAENFSTTFDRKRILIAPGTLYNEKGEFTAGDAEAGSAEEPAAGKQPAEDADSPKGRKPEASRDNQEKKRRGGKRKTVQEDPEAYGVKVVDYKKLVKGDLTQNPTIRPGDRILVAERDPQQQRDNFGGGILGGLARLLFFAPF